MSTQDRLQIITTTGQVDFRLLNESRGLTSIGRDPANDIVIEDPKVAPFQAMIDHRQQPYRLLVLNDEGEVIFEGKILPGQSTHQLSHLAQIEFGAYQVILHQSHPQPTTGTTGSVIARPSRPRSPSRTVPMPPAPSRPAPPSSLPARPAPIPPPTTPPETMPLFPGQPVSAEPALRPSKPITNGGSSGPEGVGHYKAMLPDINDDHIIIDVPEREWVIEAGQAVTFEVTITNGGPRVAEFWVMIDGLDQDWLTLPNPVNLYERTSDSVSITLRVPRSPASYAGPYYLAVIVYSPTYNNRYSRSGATLTVRPYYDYTIAELTPKEQLIYWRKNVGRTMITVTNMGNSRTRYRLAGVDKENACTFEFEAPDQGTRLAEQAELRLIPEESFSGPIWITPLSRRLVGWRKRIYTYTITVEPLEGTETTPKSQLGTVKAAPLIGPWLIIFLSLILLVLLVFLLRPRLNMFIFGDGGQMATIRNNEPVTIRWSASFFTTDVTIDPPIKELPLPLPRQGTIEIFPTADTEYTLRGNNLLSRMISLLEPAPKVLQINVNALPPGVIFEVEPPQVVGEQEITLRWQVDEADEIKLFQSFGDGESLQFLQDVSERPVGSLKVTPEPGRDRVIYILQARNPYFVTPTPAFQTVAVVTPEPTPIPTPVVKKFLVNPSVIVAEESVILDWEVEGADKVSVSPLGEVPSIGSISQSPLQNTEYILIASNGPVQTEPIIRQVTVSTPTPEPTATPEPNAPVIVDFSASKTDLVVGDEEDKTVTLFWVVQGEVTDVQLANSQGSIIQTNLPPASQLEVPVDEDSTLFTLIAYNQDKSNRESVTLSVATPMPTPTSTPPPPNILFFQAAAAEAIDDDKVDCELANADQQTCNVIVGTKINLSWQVQNATEISLKFNDSNLGNQPLTSERRETIRQDGTYVLEASNEGNPKSVTKQVQIIAESDIPAPPSRIEGTEITTNSITIEWDYDRDEENKIEGFRLYRTHGPPINNFDRIVDEATLTRSRRSYVDIPLSETCGKTYYIVAVYKDVDDIPQETDPAANSWGSPPCP